jgi:alpha/beta superfamily hydrolase
MRSTGMNDITSLPAKSDARPRRTLTAAVVIRAAYDCWRYAGTTYSSAIVKVERIAFAGSGGQQLAARLDAPDETPAAYALFAHCFTCGKDVFAAARIAQQLAARGIAVLRFDFTGLGMSEGEFANTNFSSNVADLTAAAAHLREDFQAPALLIGHSLGGAAVLAAAGSVAECKAVVTIGAPSDVRHVTHLFGDHIPTIEAEGEAEVVLAGRKFHIKRQFLLDAEEHKLAAKISGLRRALLVMHSPRDDTVDISNATRIFTAAKHPKSFISLHTADHLLTGREDAIYAANLIAAWAVRYLPQ